MKPGVTLTQAADELAAISRAAHDRTPTRLDANNTTQPHDFVESLVGNLEPTFNALLGAVEDDSLPPLYSGAVACLYPSIYEGFGLPVLEAMQCGAMVIASRDPAISEVADGAAVQVDAMNLRGWLHSMRAALDVPTRRIWQRKSVDRAAQFSGPLEPDEVTAVRNYGHDRTRNECSCGSRRTNREWIKLAVDEQGRQSNARKLRNAVWYFG